MKSSFQGNRSSFRFALFFTVAGAIQSAWGQPDPFFQFFPERRLLLPFTADGMAHRFGIAKLLENRQAKGSVGAVIPLIETEYAGVKLQGSVGASVHMQLDLSQSISVISTEFLVDFFLLDALLDEETIVRGGISHTSHHLGDNAFARLQRSKPLDYSRDFLQFFLVREFHSFRAYAGAMYAYNFVIEAPLRKPWWLQTGIDGDLVSISDGVVYAGGDIKLRQETNFGSTKRLELGFRWPSEEGRHVRIAWVYQSGFDERGQFYLDRVRWNSLGVVIGL